MIQEYRCRSCDHVFSDDNILMGKHPFTPDFTVYGCPNCKDVENFDVICDAHLCNKDVSGGKPVNGEYLHLCSDHLEKFKNL